MTQDLFHLIAFPEFTDQRGRLRVCEFEDVLPFVAPRAFLISDVPPSASRANHSVSCELFLVAITGACTLKAASGHFQQCYRIGSEKKGVLIPAGTWISLFEFQPGTQILTLASKKYRDTRYGHTPMA